MDFENIFLTKDEDKWLRKLSDAATPLPSSQHEKGLMEYGLISRELLRNTDGSSAGLHSIISAKGTAYLAHLSRSKKARRSDRFHDWIIAIVSLILGALLSDPLWELIHIFIARF